MTKKRVLEKIEEIKNLINEDAVTPTGEVDESDFNFIDDCLEEILSIWYY